MGSSREEYEERDPRKGLRLEKNVKNQDQKDQKNVSVHKLPFLFGNLMKTR